eukprot:4460048-Pleurochrysis_carterae.AAC.2
MRVSKKLIEPINRRVVLQASSILTKRIQSSRQEFYGAGSYGRLLLESAMLGRLCVRGLGPLRVNPAARLHSACDLSTLGVPCNKVTQRLLFAGGLQLAEQCRDTFLWSNLREESSCSDRLQSREPILLPRLVSKRVLAFPAAKKPSHAVRSALQSLRVRFPLQQRGQHGRRVHLPKAARGALKGHVGCHVCYAVQYRQGQDAETEAKRGCRGRSDGMACSELLAESEAQPLGVSRCDEAASCHKRIESASSTEQPHSKSIRGFRQLARVKQLTQPCCPIGCEGIARVFGARLYAQTTHLAQ